MPIKLTLPDGETVETSAKDIAQRLAQLSEWADKLGVTLAVGVLPLGTALTLSSQTVQSVPESHGKSVARRALMTALRAMKKKPKTTSSKKKKDKKTTTAKRQRRARTAINQDALRAAYRLDPNFSPTAYAKKIGVVDSAVQYHLKKWRKDGTLPERKKDTAE